jgi:peptidoglycan/LPS O-acetylase OafA/YrhL
MMTWQQRLHSAHGKPSGFDYMRIMLAMLIVVFHSFIVTQGAIGQQQLLDSPWGVLCNMLLPLFFTLSGFLVAGSLSRVRRLDVFIALRMLRIFPALLVDTLFCAVLLGGLLTSLSMREYFLHPQMHAYLLNAAGFIHYALPGIFDIHPSHKVNGQLWTIPYELECYGLLAVLFLTGLVRRRTWLLVFALAAAVSAAMWMYYSLHNVRDPGRGVLPGRMLVLCFVFGVLGYQFADRIPHSIWIFCLSLVMLVLALNWRQTTYLAAIPATYVTVFLGLMNPRRNDHLLGGDYSYGIFLYGYPLQQAIYAWIPWARDWYWNALCGLLAASLMAWASWRWVEKPALALRRFLPGQKIKPHKATLLTQVP